MTKNLNLKQRMQNAAPEERKAIRDGLPYEVGFGKPPSKSQFKPGNTYGRRGRPKGAENLHTILAEEFEAKIEVNEGGKRRRLSKRRVAMRQLANQGVKGDLKALALYAELLRKTGQLAPADQREAPVLEPRDVEAIERLAAFLTPDEPSDPDEGAES